MKKKVKFAISDMCFRCKKPIVEMTSPESIEKLGGAPVTAKIHTHYVTPWGPVCDDCLKGVMEKWVQYVRFKETGDL